MSLREYRHKRNFSRTTEPKGGKPQKGQLTFVVQKHDASHLHYDFRLEINGALASWAVPKGPSLNPAERRLAVQVEDHPLDYGSFEGTIPAGEYGGGTVMVWDRGTWESQEDENGAEGLRKGKLKFVLHGEKLQGGWTLVRMSDRHGRGHASWSSKKPQWLLIKEKDSTAKDAEERDITEDSPDSVLTGRSLDEISGGAAGKKRRVEPKKIAKARSLAATVTHDARPLKSKKLPQVQLATLVTTPPIGDKWVHEIKFDGYRMLCRIENRKATFISRNGQDWTNRLGSLSELVIKLPVKQAVLDGEVVVLDAQGVSHFQALQNALGNGGDRKELVYFVFDLLSLEGEDFTDKALTARKSRLKELLDKMPEAYKAVRYSEHVEGSGNTVWKQACQVGAEGIISKRRDAPYVVGRGDQWLKCKCRQSQELVIGGFTKPTGSRVGLGALLLGYHTAGGELRYAGRVGTGFSVQSLKLLYVKLKELKITKSPFSTTPHLARSAGVQWVRPSLVAQVEFANWTTDGLLRQAAFQGLRTDKPAKEIIRERPRKTSKRRTAKSK